MPRIVVFTTGGTIGSESVADRGTYAPGAATATSLYEALQRTVAAEIRHVPFCNLLSSQLTFDTVGRLAASVRTTLLSEDAAGVVISHGTDTLEETAFALTLLIGPGKPVVLTGAQRAFGLPDYDGIRNLTDAICTACSPAAEGRGTLVCFAGSLFDAHTVTKVDTFALDGFSSFAGRQAGTVGPNGPLFNRAASAPRRGTLEGAHFVPVELVTAAMNSSARQFLHCLEDGAQGIVIEAFGAGNLPADFSGAVRRAIKSGVPVVIASRCPAGSTMPIYSGPGAGADLADAGAIFAGSLRGPKARILLSLALSATRDHEQLRELFSRHDPANWTTGATTEHVQPLARSRVD